MNEMTRVGFAVFILFATLITEIPSAESAKLHTISLCMLEKLEQVKRVPNGSNSTGSLTLAKFIQLDNEYNRPITSYFKISRTKKGKKSTHELFEISNKKGLSEALVNLWHLRARTEGFGIADPEIIVFEEWMKQNTNSSNFAALVDGFTARHLTLGQVQDQLLSYYLRRAEVSKKDKLMRMLSPKNLLANALSGASGSAKFILAGSGTAIIIGSIVPFWQAYTDPVLTEPLAAVRQAGKTHLGDYQISIRRAIAGWNDQAARLEYDKLIMDYEALNGEASSIDTVSDVKLRAKQLESLKEDFSAILIRSQQIIPESLRPGREMWAELMFNRTRGLGSDITIFETQLQIARMNMRQLDAIKTDVKREWTETEAADYTRSKELEAIAQNRIVGALVHWQVMRAITPETYLTEDKRFQPFVELSRKYQDQMALPEYMKEYSSTVKAVIDELGFDLRSLSSFKDLSTE